MWYTAQAEKITPGLRRSAGPPSKSTEPCAKVNAKVSMEMPSMPTHTGGLWLVPWQECHVELERPARRCTAAAILSASKSSALPSSVQQTLAWLICAGGMDIPWERLPAKLKGNIFPSCHLMKTAVSKQEKKKIKQALPLNHTCPCGQKAAVRRRTLFSVLTLVLFAFGLFINAILPSSGTV